MGTRVRLPSPDPPGLQAYISPECTLFSFCSQMYDHHNIQWEPISALLEAPTQLAGVLRLTVSHNASALYFSHGRSWHQTLCNIPFRQHQCNYQKCSYFSNLPRYFDPLVDYVLSGNPAKFIESSYTAPWEGVSTTVNRMAFPGPCALAIPHSSTDHSQILLSWPRRRIAELHGPCQPRIIGSGDPVLETPYVTEASPAFPVSKGPPGKTYERVHVKQMATRITHFPLYTEVSPFRVIVIGTTHYGGRHSRRVYGI